MYGLTSTPASSASLLLNLEAVFTALLAWFLFRENFDRRIALGMFAIVLGGMVLAWSPSESGGKVIGPLLIAAACLCWTLDNNLTRKVSTSDAVVIAGLKGLVAGAVNTGLALLAGYSLPPIVIAGAAPAVGFLGYGVSLVLFVLALRLGTARAGAYFSVAPFFGTVLALLLQSEPVTWQLATAGALMAIGVWLHLSERHTHVNTHDVPEHMPIRTTSITDMTTTSIGMDASRTSTLTCTNRWPMHILTTQTCTTGITTDTSHLAILKINSARPRLKTWRGH